MPSWGAEHDWGPPPPFTLIPTEKYVQPTIELDRSPNMRHRRGYISCMATENPTTERDRIIDALTGEWSAIRELVSTFDEDDWGAQTPCPGWSSRDIIAHIIGTESMLAGEQTPSSGDEMPSFVRNEIGELNQAWIEHFRDVDTAELLDRFDAISGSRAETLRAMSDADFFAESWTPEGTGTYAKFMRIRIFDCWMHEQDLRDATSAPGGMESPAASIAVEEMIGKLGYVVGKRASAPERSTLTLRLTGAAGRTVSVAVEGRARLLDEALIDPTVALEMPAGVFARLYGGRVAPADVSNDIRIDGDGELAQRVLRELAVTM